MKKRLFAFLIAFCLLITSAPQLYASNPVSGTNKSGDWQDYKFKIKVEDTNFNWQALKESKFNYEIKYIWSGAEKTAISNLSASSNDKEEDANINLPSDLADLESVNVIADFEDPNNTNYDPDIPVVIEESTSKVSDDAVVKTVKLTNSPVTKIKLTYVDPYGKEADVNKILQTIPRNLGIKFVQGGIETTGLILPGQNGIFAPMKEGKEQNKFVLNKYEASKNSENVKLKVGLLNNEGQFIKGTYGSEINTKYGNERANQVFMLKTDLTKPIKDLAKDGETGAIELKISSLPEAMIVPLKTDGQPENTPGDEYIRLTFNANGKTKDAKQTDVIGKFKSIYSGKYSEYNDKSTLYVDVRPHTKWKVVKDLIGNLNVEGSNGEVFDSWTPTMEDYFDINESKTFDALYGYGADIIEDDGFINPGEGYGRLHLNPNGGVFVRTSGEGTSKKETVEKRTHSFYLKKIQKDIEGETYKEYSIDEILNKFNLSIKSKEGETATGWYKVTRNFTDNEKIDKVKFDDNNEKTLFAGYRNEDLSKKYKDLLKAKDLTVLEGQTTIPWEYAVTLADRKDENVQDETSKKDAKAFNKRLDNANIKEDILSVEDATTPKRDSSYKVASGNQEKIGKIKVTFKDNTSLEIENQKLIVKPITTKIVVIDSVHHKDPKVKVEPLDEEYKGGRIVIKDGETIISAEVLIENSSEERISINNNKLEAGKTYTVHLIKDGYKTITEKIGPVKLNPDELNKIIPTAESVLKNFQDNDGKMKPGVDKEKYQALVDAINGNGKSGNEKVEGGKELVYVDGDTNIPTGKKSGDVKIEEPTSEQDGSEKQKRIDDAVKRINDAIKNLTLKDYKPKFADAKIEPIKDGDEKIVISEIPEGVKKITITDVKGKEKTITNNDGKWMDGNKELTPVDGKITIPKSDEQNFNDRKMVRVKLEDPEAPERTNEQQIVVGEKADTIAPQSPNVKVPYANDTNIKIDEPRDDAKKIIVEVTDKNDTNGKNPGKAEVVKDSDNKWKVNGNEVSKDENGKLIIPLPEGHSPLEQGDKVKVTAEDKSENKSEPYEKTVEAKAKTQKPTIDKANRGENTVTGTAAKGTDITVTLTPKATKENPNPTPKTFTGKADGNGNFTVATDKLIDGDKIVVIASEKDKADNESEPKFVGVDTTELGKSIEKAKEIAKDIPEDSNDEFDKKLKDELKKAEDVKTKGDKGDTSVDQEAVDKAKKDLDDAIAKKDADTKVKAIEDKVKNGEKLTEDEINQAQKAIDDIEPDANPSDGLKKDLQDRLDKAKVVDELKDVKKELDDAIKTAEDEKKPNNIIDDAKEKVKEVENIINGTDTTKTVEQIVEIIKTIKEKVEILNQRVVQVTITFADAGSKNIGCFTNPGKCKIVVTLERDNKVIESIEEQESDVDGTCSITLENTLQSGDFITIKASKYDSTGENKVMLDGKVSRTIFN